MAKVLGQSFWGVWLMGSSTVRGFSRRLRFFQFILLALFALTFAGCELEEGDSTSPGSSPPLSTHTFGNKVNVRFMVPTVDGPVEVTSNDSLQRALKRAVPEPENVRSQSTPAEYVGNILTGDNGFGIYPADTDNGVIEIYNSAAKAVVGAFIIDTYAIKVGYDTGTITYRYYPPSPDEGLSLSTFVTNDITSEYSVSDSSVVRAGDPVEVQVYYSWFTDYPDGVLNRVYSGTISLNGEVVFTFENVRAIGDSEFLPVTPCFASKESGNARLELVGNWGDERHADFIQKGLKFRQETQDFELQPNQTAAIRNDFGWDLGANPNSLVDPSWEVEIVNPQKQVIKTFSGTGRQINADWDTNGLPSAIRLVPIDRLSQDGEVPVYGYRLKAKAKIGSPVFATGSIFYELTNDREAGELQIVNVKLDPDPPFQNEGESVDLTAEILAVGLEGLTEDDLDWWVELIAPDGSPTGDPLATGKGFEVAASWDGKVDGVPVEAPSSYVLRIRAATCNGVTPRRTRVRAQQVLCQEDFFDVELRKISSIKVLDANRKTLGLGFSENIKIAPTSEERQALDERLKLLGVVHRLESQELRIEVSGLEFKDAQGNSSEPPPTLSFKAKSLVTGVTLPVGNETLEGVLLSNSSTAGASYVLEFSFPEGFVKSGETLGKTRYSVGEIFTIPGMSALAMDVTQVVKSIMENSGFYAAPRVSVGIFDEAASDAKDFPNKFPDGEPGPGQVEATEENLLTTGFEALEISVDDPNVSDLEPAVVKIRQPGNILVWNFHGNEYGLLGLSSGRDTHYRGNPQKTRLNRVLRPSAELSPHMAGVKTLILSSCSALTVGDFNNNYTGPLRPSESNPSGVDVWPGGSLRQFGGAKWDDMTGNGANGTVVLGYNGPAPFNEGDPETGNLCARVLDLYKVKLQSLSGRADVEAGAAEQWAWMSANVEFANTAKGENDIRWLTLNASALDSNFYYYIPHLVDRSRRIDLGERPEPGPGQTPGPYAEPNGIPAPDFQTVEKSHPVWRIHRSRWSQANGDWKRNRSLGEFVPIPATVFTPPIAPNP